MPRKKTPVQTLTWDDYILLLTQQRDHLVKQYGQQRSGFAGWWGKRNDERASATLIDSKPLEQVETQIKKHNAKNFLSRFFIRAFTQIEKKRSLLHYRKTVDLLNFLISQPTPLTQEAVNQHFLSLNQLPSAPISQVSGLKSFIRRFKKALAKITLLPPAPAAEKSAPIPKEQKAAPTQDAPSFGAASPKVPTFFEKVPAAPTPIQAALSPEENAFLKKFDDDMKAFRAKIAEEKQFFQGQVDKLNADYPHDETQRKAKYQQAFVATAGRLKKIYFKLSLRYHPDKVSNALKTHAEDCFKTILGFYSKSLDEIEHGLNYQSGDPDWDDLMTTFHELRKRTEEFCAGVDELLSRIAEVERGFERIRTMAKKLEKTWSDINQQTVELNIGLVEVGTIHTHMTDDKKLLDTMTDRACETGQKALDDAQAAHQKAETMSRQLDALLASVKSHQTSTLTR